jgi:hypothetical protein
MLAGMPAKSSPTTAYLEGLVNELPEFEVEAKIALTGDVQIRKLLEGIATTFASRWRRFSLYAPKILATEQLIEKYTSEHGHFSIMRSIDESDRIKRKARVSVSGRDDGIRLRREEQIPVPANTDAVKLAMRRYKISSTELKFLGTLYRRKRWLVLINQRSGRVYTVVVDRSHPTHDMQQSVVQLEIEYKGTRPDRVKASPALSEDVLVEEVAAEIRSIRKVIAAHLRSHGVEFHLTEQSKTRWLEKVRAAAAWNLAV